MAAPPSNFATKREITDHVDSNAPMLLGLAISLVGLSAIIVALRCWVRHFWLHAFSIDDVIMIGALGMAISTMACFIRMVQHGAGRWMKDIPDEWKEGLRYWSYIIGPLLTTGICLVKIFLAFFLRRFVQKVWQKRFLLGMVVFTSVFMIYSICTYTFACIPLEAAWNQKITDANCKMRNQLMDIGTANSVVNILTDLAMVALPVLVVVDLQVNRKTKISLVLILSLGLFACAASVIRAVYAYSMTDPDYSRRYDFLVWFKYVIDKPRLNRGHTDRPDRRSVELHAGILAASLPTLRPLFSKILKSSTTYGRNTKQRGYGTYAIGTARGQGNQVELSDMRHPYYRAGESSFQAPKPGAHSSNNFTQITTNRGGFGDDSSEEFILRPPAGITKRTGIVIS
ncbi:oxidoreductase [Apiospora aurea]|uniref:Oxidoreductase n=1 Tax=Apiospora aurea TaxID=335848 RepID=A0ABR1QB59_9PEZI